MSTGDCTPFHLDGRGKKGGISEQIWDRFGTDLEPIWDQIKATCKGRLLSDRRLKSDTTFFNG